MWEMGKEDFSRGLNSGFTQQPLLVVSNIHRSQSQVTAEHFKTPTFSTPQRNEIPMTRPREQRRKQGSWSFHSEMMESSGIPAVRTRSL